MKSYQAAFKAQIGFDLLIEEKTLAPVGAARRAAPYDGLRTTGRGSGEASLDRRAAACYAEIGMLILTLRCCGAIRVPPMPWRNMLVREHERSIAFSAAEDSHTSSSEQHKCRSVDGCTARLRIK
jgi:hypothetical protein